MSEGIVLNQKCDLCGGDGYLSVTKAQWEEFVAWTADPTEDKANSTDKFPYFLKDLPNYLMCSFLKDKVSMPCTKCHGHKVVSQIISLDDLKKLLG